jgi:hypothetical protein
LVLYVHRIFVIITKLHIRNNINVITTFVTRLTRRVSLVEQELPTLSKHLSSPPVFSGVRVSQSLVLYECFIDCCLSFCTLSFGHCVFCSSSIYGFWLPLWYLQTLLVIWSPCSICRFTYHVYHCFAVLKKKTILFTYLYLFVFIYVYWCPISFLLQIMFI